MLTRTIVPAGEDMKNGEKKTARTIPTVLSKGLPSPGEYWY